MEEISSGSVAFFQNQLGRGAKVNVGRSMKRTLQMQFFLYTTILYTQLNKSFTTIRKRAIKTCKFYFATNHY